MDYSALGLYSSKDMKIMEIALRESLKFQANYAELLNMYDGGERMIFQNTESWIERLREIGTIKEDEL